MCGSKKNLTRRRGARAPLHSTLSPETALFLELASQLAPRDAAVLNTIIRRTVEITESDGEETALAVLGQVESILRGRFPDA